jgi:mitochondrial fission protein ELM1
MKNPEIWVLTDDRAGNSKQALALAEILGKKYKQKRIKYNFLIKLPNFLKFGFMGLKAKSQRSLKRGKPDIIISAGRRTAPVAVTLKKNTSARIIQIMNPSTSLEDIDVLLLPYHDKKPKKKFIKKTVFIHGAISSFDYEQVESHASFWEDRFKKLAKPYIAVFIGGKSKHTDFTKINAKVLARHLHNMATKEQASLIISSSRRTPKGTLECLENELKNQGNNSYYIYNFHKDTTANPYLGLLGLADKIVVTGDSISMCSEATQTLKPVYIFAEVNMIGKKHRKFINYLFENNLASPLHENYKPFKPSNSLGNDTLKSKIFEILAKQ